MEKCIFGTYNGEDVIKYKLTNKTGSYVEILNLGCIIQSINIFKDGKFTDVLLGYDTVEEYLSNTGYFGAAIGRFGNRIRNGKFTLDGTEYTLATNTGANHIHGGVVGFNKKIWKATETDNSLVFSYTSIDGEEGYPGTLDVTITYSFSDENELLLDYKATTDKKTIINLTNHSYFNLNGTGDVLGHNVQILSDKVCLGDKTNMVTGELMEVAGTAFDFNNFKTIGCDLEKIGGYDNNYALNADGTLKKCATVKGDNITMECFTNQVGVQFYTANSVSTRNGKNGATYEKFCGLCLETQGYPDAPNIDSFPSAVLDVGETYVHKTVYKFI